MTPRPLIKGPIPLIKSSTCCPLLLDFPREPQAGQSSHKGPRDTGARPAWVVADAGYGADSKLRFFLEEKGQP
jgi:hypothetical protein